MLGDNSTRFGVVIKSTESCTVWLTVEKHIKNIGLLSFFPKQTEPKNLLAPKKTPVKTHGIAGYR